MLESTDLQKQICKHGFPKGNVFEYAADQIQKFEKKHKEKKAAKIQEKLQDIKTFARNKSPDRGISENSSIRICLLEFSNVLIKI